MVGGEKGLERGQWVPGEESSCVRWLPTLLSPQHISVSSWRGRREQKRQIVPFPQLRQTAPPSEIQDRSRRSSAQGARPAHTALLSPPSASHRPPPTLPLRPRAAARVSPPSIAEESLWWECALLSRSLSCRGSQPPEGALAPPPSS